MELRCKNCNKLFRVADDKITGSGVKFTCTRCGEIVKITREDFEQYKMKSAAPALAPAGSASHGSPGRAAETPAGTGADDLGPFDPGKATTAASATRPGEKKAPIFVKPAPPAHTLAESTDNISLEKAFPLFHTETEQAPAPKPAIHVPPEKPLQSASVAPAAPGVSAPSVKEERHPAPVIDAKVQSRASSGFGKKAAVFLLILLIIGGAAFGVKFYYPRLPAFVSLARSVFTQKVHQLFTKKAHQLSLPDGLQVQNASGGIDAVSGDLILTGQVENTTDKPKSAWFIVAEVYDAQGAVLIKGKLLNGKQIYTRRDYDIMAKRGVNVEELKQKNLHDQGVIIPARGTANFEIRIMEPPAGVASFNAVLQPFDPVQLYKEMAEEQK